MVAAFLSNRAKTGTGKENTSAVRKALVDVALLNLAGDNITDNITKVMVFTDSSFRVLIARRAKKLGTENVNMMVCDLPCHLNQELMDTLNKARSEIRAHEE